MPSFRLAARTLVRSPFVTAVAIGSLALGIGANTAIFSLIQRVLIRSLPVAEPDRLVNVLAEGPNPGSQSCNQAGNCEVIFSYPMFKDLEQGQDLVTLAGHRLIGADVAFRGKSLSGEGVAVSGSYFPVLGLQPALGRLLGPNDDNAIGGNPVTVLSYRYWERELGADPGVIGQTLLINGKALTIVGVAPAGFDGTTLGARPRVFVPLSMIGTLSWLDNYQNRLSYWLYVFGRLAPGVREAKALAAVNTIYHSIVNDVEAPLQQGISDETLRQFKAKAVRFAPGDQGQSNLRGQDPDPADPAPPGDRHRVAGRLHQRGQPAPGPGGGTGLGNGGSLVVRRRSRHPGGTAPGGVGHPRGAGRAEPAGGVGDAPAHPLVPSGPAHRHGALRPGRAGAALCRRARAGRHLPVRSPAGPPGDPSRPAQRDQVERGPGLRGTRGEPVPERSGHRADHPLDGAPLLRRSLPQESRSMSIGSISGSGSTAW